MILGTVKHHLTCSGWKTIRLWIAWFWIITFFKCTLTCYMVGCKAWFYIYAVILLFDQVIRISPLFLQFMLHNLVQATSKCKPANGISRYRTLIVVHSLHIAHLWQQCHNSKFVIFQEKCLKVLKCYNFLWVQWWHNCSLAVSSANCVMRLWWYRYELPDNTHTHAQLYVHATLLLRVRAMSAAGHLLSGAPKSHHTLWLHFSVRTYTRDSFSVLIRLRCMDDKISWLGGWASQWRPPQHDTC
jgi:hypothetical protein